MSDDEDDLEEVVEEELEEEEDEDDDDNDSEEEEESEEEIHRRGRPTKKPRRQSSSEQELPKSHRFLIEEADVSDDEGDEDDEDLLGDDDLGPDEANEALASSREHRRAMAVRDRQIGRGVDIATQIERRYAQGDMDEGEGEEEEEERTPIRQQSYQPSVKDPKLWQVKVRPGKEREVVIYLLQKYINKDNRPDRLLIKSAVCNDNISGYVYIEAEKEAHVKAAIQGVTNTFEWKMKLVPIREMTDVLKPSKKKVAIAPNSWVRVTRGLYRGDIGQVISYDEAKLKALVKLIPRLGEATQEEVNERDPLTGKRKQASVILNRPPARFFNEDEYDGTIGSHNGERIHLGNRFKDGYLLKSMNIKSLETEKVQPTVEEVQKFQSSRNKLSSEDDAMNAISKTVKRKTTFTKGDTVEVIESDLKHLMGIVESVDGSDMVTIRPLHEDLKDLLSFHASDLKKHFKVGDHVKVIAGRYEGETGLVVSINDNIVVIFSDLTQQEFKVLATDIQECTEVSTGKLQLGNYELHDLVQLNPHSMGVIVKVESDSFRVLDNNGIVQHVRLQEMGAKRYNKDATAFDKQQNPMGIGDVVSIVDGKYKGRQGTVKYIFRSYAFLQAKDMLDNSGIFVVRSGSCTLLGGRSNQARARPNNSFAEPYGMSPRGPGSRGGPPGSMRPPMGRGGPGGGGRGRGREDGMLHKTVTITKGPWKGLVGIVKDANEKVLRIELHTNCKTVTVDRSGIREHGEGGSSAGGGGSGGRRGYEMSSGIGSSWDPSRTPLRDGSQTPLRMGTPLRRTDGSNDPWNAPNTPMRPDTPGHGWGDDNDYGVPTPGVYGNYYSPAPYTSEPAYTPNANPSTPSAFSMENATPFTPAAYTDQHTPAADSPFSAPTPGTPSTPGITPATPSEGSGYDTGYDEGYGRKDDGDSNWQMTDIEVKIENEMFGNGAYKDKTGVIKEVYPDNSCRVFIYDRHETITIPGDYLSPVAPGKKDKIKIVRGELRGSTGLLIGLDGNDGIVKMDNVENVDIKILGIHFLAKLASQ